jgi:hypothetical protein
MCDRHVTSRVSRPSYLQFGESLRPAVADRLARAASPYDVAVPSASSTDPTASLVRSEFRSTRRTAGAVTDRDAMNRLRPAIPGGSSVADPQEPVFAAGDDGWR